MEKQNEIINVNFEQLQSQVHITSDIANTMKNICVQVNSIQKELAVNQKHLIETRKLMNDALKLGHRELRSESRDWYTKCLQSDQRSNVNEGNNMNEENENIFDAPDDSQFNTESKNIDDLDVENNVFETVTNKRNVVKKRKVDERSPGNMSMLFSQRVVNGLQVPSRLMSQPEKQQQQGGVSKKNTYVGSSKNPNFQIKAQRSLLKKAFFYLGNVSKTNETDMKSFIESLGFEVYLCYAIKKRANNEERDDDHGDDDDSREGNAFRVCINADASGKFLDPETWPLYFVIRRWSFSSSKRDLTKANDNGPAAVSRRARVRNDHTSQTASMEVQDDGNDNRPSNDVNTNINNGVMQ